MAPSTLTTSTPSTTTTTTASGDSRALFVLFGDSITQQGFSCPAGEGGGAGWCARLADRYARTADVVLRGYSGYNTEWARSVLLPRVFKNRNDEKRKKKKRRASLVTIFFGANDASLPDRLAERQHVPLERFKANLKALIEASVDAAAAAASGEGEEGEGEEDEIRTALVVVITPPPIDEDARVRHAISLARQSGDPNAEKDPLLQLPERTDEAARRYASAAVDVVRGAFQSADGEKNSSSSSSVKVEVLDLYSEFKREGGRTSDECSSSSSPATGSWKELLSDGLHLSARGNERLFELLLQLIAERAPHLLPENLPTDAPDRAELEPCPR